MKRRLSVLCTFFFTLSAVLATDGCAGFSDATFPDTVTTSAASPSSGAILGSVYGGHAPLVGAHVYLLQVGSGYGAQATSLLRYPSSSTTYPTYQNVSDPNIPVTGTGTPWVYEMTLSDGTFNVTGDYTCTPGEPVYMYAWGGSPSFPSTTPPTSGTSPNVFNIGGANGAAGTATESFASGGSVTSATLNAAGSDLQSGTYTLNASGGGGTGATIQITVDTSNGFHGGTNYGKVTAVTLENAGSGYTSAPSFPFTGATRTPTTAPSYNVTLSSIVDNVQFTVATSNASGVASPPENFYIGEPLTFAGLTGTVASLVGTSGTVVATGLTTMTFDVQVAGTLGSGSAAVPVPAGATVTGSPTNNPEVVNLAMLGVCPSGGNFTATGQTVLPTNTAYTPLSYVYMNEVSTAAMAYAMQGFTLSTNNDALHFGAPASNLTGIENAAMTANMLYDIQGSNVSTSYAGEGHIARSSTPAGNGTVPQDVLDTVGNILAACVDSGSTYTFGSGTGTISSQCGALLTYATNTGVISTAATNPGTEPQDTATAAINIARHPAGAPSTGVTQAQWVSSLFSLPTGNVPFTPNLTSEGKTPNDFSVGINYPSTYNASFNEPEGMSIDASGDVWINDAASRYVTKMLPTGAIGVTYLSSYVPGYIAIDPSGDVWWGPHSTTGGSVTGNVTEITNTGTVLSTTSYASLINSGYAYTTAIDGSGNVYLPNYPQTANYNYAIEELYPTPGGTVSGTSGTLEQNYATASTTCLGTTSRPDHIALDDATGGTNLWIVSESSPTICAFNVATGTPLTGYPKTVPNFGGNTPEPVQLGIDASENVWFPTEVTNRMYKLTQSTGTLSDITAGTTVTLNDPFSASIDGGGNVWVTNRNSNSVSEFTNAGTAVTQTVNYEGGNLSTPLNAAVDLSGNLWITNYGGASVTEMVGIALPTSQPLSVAQGTNKLGTTP